MSATMQASVLVDVGRLELRDVPRPRPRPMEVLIAVSAVGICGTDLHIFSGESNYNLDAEGRPIPLHEQPQTLGHEVVGTVTEVGDEVRDLSEGRRVVIDQGLSCTPQGIDPHCDYCASGDSHQCEHYQEFGITGLPGGFAEAMAVPAACAVPLRGDLEAAQAALTEPLACVLHSSNVLKHARARFAIGAEDPARRVRTILVQGAGPAGLLFIQVLRQVLGFDGSLLVSESDPTRAGLAQRFGARLLDARDRDPVEALLAETDGRGVELLIEATGSGAAFAEIPRMIRKQATVLAYGIGYGGTSLDRLNLLHWKEPTFLMPVGASGHFPRSGGPQVYRDALGLLEAGTIDVAPIVSHRHDGLRALAAAFDGVPRDHVKGVLVL
jgi:L-iditol 2-dehydrogenase